MIQPLRRAHRYTFTAMACALAAVLFAGLRARPPQAPHARPSLHLPASAYVIQRSNRLWQKHNIVTEFYGDSTDMQRFYIVLWPQDPLLQPDPLLYWSAAESDGGTLPPGAQLIGPFSSGKVFALQAAGECSGRLILYSGALREIVDATLVEKLP